VDQSFMTQQEYADRERALNDQIIDRIAKDPSFAEALKSDPMAALEKAGLRAEVEALQTEVNPPEQFTPPSAPPRPADEEVTAQRWVVHCWFTAKRTCNFWSAVHPCVFGCDLVWRS
jgi:hypothetical protein